MLDSFKYKDERNAGQVIHDVNIYVKNLEQQLIKLKSFKDCNLSAETYRGLIMRIDNIKGSLMALVQQPSY